MKLIRLAVASASLAVMVACSSMQRPALVTSEVEDPEKNIPAIDEMIVGLKSEYIDRCYMPVAKRNPPDNQCQTELFQLLERRYRLSYTREHVDMASDELFFRDVDNRVRKMVKTDSEIRSAVREKFTSMNDMMAYYKVKYGFHPITKVN